MKAEYGYMGKILFVDLKNRKIHEEEIIFIPEGGERGYWTNLSGGGRVGSV